MPKPVAWYVRKGSKEHGPFASRQLKKLAAEDKIKPDTPLRRGEDGAWVKAAKVKGLFADVPPARPAEPAQAPPPAKPAKSVPPISDEWDDGESDARGSPFDFESKEQVVPSQLPARRSAVPSELVDRRPADVHPAAAGSPAVQVNIQQTEKVSNSLGIASIILGTLSFFMICVPPVGFFFSGLGFVLGVAGLFLAMKRRGSGIGFPIAGAAISSVGVVGLLLVTFIFTSAAAGLGAAAAGAREAADEYEAEQKREADARDAAIALAAGNEPTVGSDTVGDPAPAAATNVVAFGETFSAPGLSVSLVKAEVERPELTTMMGNSGRSEDEALLLTLRIQNRDERKIIRYSDNSFSPNLTLRDDVDNRIRGIDYGFSNELVGQLDSGEEIMPEQEATHREPFSVPPPKTEYLILKVNLSAFGGDGEAEFVIPAEKIEGFAEVGVGEVTEAQPQEDAEAYSQEEQEADFSTAIGYLGENDYEQAKPLLERLAVAQPDDAVLRVRLAMCAGELGELDECLRWTFDALILNPRLTAAIASFGWLQGRLGQPAVAEAWRQRREAGPVPAESARMVEALLANDDE